MWTIRSLRYHTLGNPNLPTSKINSILKKYEKTWTAPRTPIIKRIDFSACPSNDPNEDTHVEVAIEKDAVFLGVFDGHRGNHCAHVVRSVIPGYFLRQKENPVSERLFKTFVLLDRDICGMAWRILPELSGPRDSLNEIDPQKRLEALKISMTAISGSCGIVAHIQENKLHVAHSGDCRAVLGHVDSDGTLKASTLTVDHQPSNLLEYARLHREHPGEEKTVISSHGNGPMRVLGDLLPSRAFGDARYKWSLREQDQIDNLVKSMEQIDFYELMRPQHLYTPPYLTAEPDVTSREITSDTKFLVIASDGLFDMLTDAAVVKEVEKYLSKETTHSNAATHLIQAALQNGRGKTHLSRMLSLPAAYTRNYRDDITCKVVFFNTIEQDLAETASETLVEYELDDTE